MDKEIRYADFAAGLSHARSSDQDRQYGSSYLRSGPMESPHFLTALANQSHSAHGWNMTTQRSKECPRVLIVSHNPFSDIHNNGKLFGTLFGQWDHDKLAQLYLTTDVPTFSQCERFFQLHDIDMLRRMFFSSSPQGRQVSRLHLPAMQAYKQKIAHSSILAMARNNMSPLLRLTKDILWSIVGYKTRDLCAFIDDFRPQVVLFHSYSDVFAFSLVQWICHARDIPLIMLTTDDYLFGALTIDPFLWIRQTRTRRAYSRAVRHSHCVIVVSQKMSDEYSSRFGGNYVVLTNAIPTDTVVRYASMNATIRLLYAGNLSLNRWKVLALIGECLEELDKEDNLRGELSIYSVVAPRGRESSSLSRSPFCEFKGRLEPLVLRQAKIDSDILVHVEAFDRQNRSATRFSMSTKIPEYLASGRCIFAVGPGDVASMEYIAQHDLGVVAISDDRNTVKTALRRIMMDRSMRARYADRGIEIARERHNAGTIAEQVRRLLSGALDSREDNNLQSNPFRTASR